MARRLLISVGFAADLRMSRLQRLDGLGSSVTDWEPNEPRWVLKSSGFAVGLKVCGAESEGWDCISGSAIADLEL